jgi:virulence-associated protein VapD
MEKNTEKYYKAFNFDLDQSKLDKYYEKHNTNAYKEIKKFFIDNNIAHRQGSGYLSKEKLTDRQARNIIESLDIVFPWIIKSAKQIDITNVEGSFNGIDIIIKGKQRKNKTKNNLKTNQQSKIATNTNNNLADKPFAPKLNKPYVSPNAPKIPKIKSPTPTANDPVIKNGKTQSIGKNKPKTPSNILTLKH